MIRRRLEPADYCVIGSAPDNRLSQFERLTLLGGEELGRALSWITKQLENFSFGKLAPKIDFSQVHSNVEFYTTPALRSTPKTFFRHPPKQLSVREIPVHGFRDGEIVDLEFDSSYTVQNPAILEEFSSYASNRKVHARMWRHHEGARATLIAIHGWSMGDQRLNSLALLPGFFYQCGMDVVLFELPFHGRRRPRGSHPEELTLFPSSNVARTNEAMGQVISDLRSIKCYLARNGATNIGCLGMSLGGYCAALWAGLDTLAFCIPVVPLVSMADVAWRVLIQTMDREKLKSEGLTLAKLKKIYYLHSPLSHEPRVKPEHLMIVAGTQDKIVPAKQPRLLWEHWGKPKMLWLKGGHAAQLGGMQAFYEIVAFLKELGFVAPSEELR